MCLLFRLSNECGLFIDTRWWWAGSFEPVNAPPFLSSEKCVSPADTPRPIGDLKSVSFAAVSLIPENVRNEGGIDSFFLLFMPCAKSFLFLFLVCINEVDLLGGCCCCFVCCRWTMWDKTNDLGGIWGSAAGHTWPHCDYPPLRSSTVTASVLLLLEQRPSPSREELARTWAALGASCLFSLLIVL